MTAVKALRPSPLDLFNIGHDTQAIAKIAGISEAVALKLITMERSERLGRANPYENSKREKPGKALIPFAGQQPRH